MYIFELEGAFLVFLKEEEGREIMLEAQGILDQEVFHPQVSFGGVKFETWWFIFLDLASIDFAFLFSPISLVFMSMVYSDQKSCPFRSF